MPPGASKTRAGILPANPGTSLTANERTNVWTNVRSFAVECEFCEFFSQKFAFAPSGSGPLQPVKLGFLDQPEIVHAFDLA